MHARELITALQRSREELVSSREDDRRRIRRDLHDGLGPTLAGMLLRLDVAAERLDRDPQAARAELDVLKSQLQASTDEVRRLVHDLRPPALDELGLVAAIRAQASALSDTAGRRGVTFEVKAPDVRPALPAAVEVALLRVAAEAMTNVVRHARATHCSVRLEFDDHATLDIVDDGAGIHGASTDGVGLRSMHERAAELGGTIEVTSQPGGGTRVCMSLPIGPR